MNLIEINKKFKLIRDFDKKRRPKKYFKLT